MKQGLGEADKYRPVKTLRHPQLQLASLALKHGQDRPYCVDNICFHNDSIPSNGQPLYFLTSDLAQNVCAVYNTRKGPPPILRRVPASRDDPPRIRTQLLGIDKGSRQVACATINTDRTSLINSYYDD